jgi:hypothetical protein
MMPTLADPGVDVDTIDHLDWGTPCTIGVTVHLSLEPDAGPCPNTAAWDMTCRRCAAATPICNDHKRVVEKSDLGACQRCKRSGRPRRIFTFFRIGGEA